MKMTKYAEGYRDGMQDICDKITEGASEGNNDAVVLAEVFDWVRNNGAVLYCPPATIDHSAFIAQLERDRARDAEHRENLPHP
jgi:hypothetical protein